MKQPIISIQAYADLEEIRDYISAQNPINAEIFLDKIYVQLQQISNLAAIVKLQPRLGTGIRSLVFGNYLIYFRERNGEVEIIRIIHGARTLLADEFL